MTEKHGHRVGFSQALASEWRRGAFRHAFASAVFLDSRPTPLNSFFTNASHLIPLLSPRLAIRIRTIPPSLEEEERGTRGGEGRAASRGSGENGR